MRPSTFLPVVGLLIWSSVAPAAAESPEERHRWLIALETAVGQRDYDAALRLVAKGEKDDAAAASALGFLLLGGIEMMAAEAHGEGLDEIRRDLLWKVSPPERMQMGLTFLRRAAAMGSSTALGDLDRKYRFGNSRLGLPKDVELADCFAAAGQGRRQGADCIRLEADRGYLSSPGRAIPGISTSPMLSEQQLPAGEAPFFRGDLNGTYAALRPRAETGDDDAQYFLSGVLLYADYAPVGDLSDPERHRLGLMWLRKSAAAGRAQALNELGNSYMEGRIGLPVDAELGTCLRAVARSGDKPDDCMRMEAAKGYVPTP